VHKCSRPPSETWLPNSTSKPNPVDSMIIKRTTIRPRSFLTALHLLQIASPFRQLLGNFNQRLGDRVPSEDSLVELGRLVYALASRTARFHKRNCFLCESISVLCIY